MSSVTLIGAGPAGSIAAMLLARAEWNATLIEQHRFPRDKVCGECLSSLGFDVLRRTGLADAFMALSPVRLSRTLLHADGRSALINLGEPMWGISRRRFDDFLLEAARAAGVIVRQPVRCEAIDAVPPSPSGRGQGEGRCIEDVSIHREPLHRTRPHPNLLPEGEGTREEARAVTVCCRDLATNELFTLHPDRVILADGKAALLPTRPIATTDLGIKAHFANVAGPRDAIQLFGFAGHYGGVAPIEDDRFNVALSVPARRVKDFDGDLDALFAQLLRENPSLLDQFQNATRIGDWLASPLPRFSVVDDWPNGVIPLGNAAAALEPIGGEGMGLAMRSAELAAEAIVRNDPPSRLRRQFSRLWRPRRFATRTAALMLSSSHTAGPSIDLADCAPRLTRVAMRMMGKR